MELKVALILRRLSMGGIENLILKIAEYLAKQHKVTIIATNGKGDWDNKATEVGAEIKVFDFWKENSILDYVSSLSDYINQNDYDCIFYNDSPLGVSISPIINISVKQFVVLHAIDEHSTRNALIGKKFVDGFIAISPKVESILNNNKATNVKLIPNGIKMIPSNIYNYSDSKTLNFIYCGRISHMDKGVLFIPELLSYFSNLNFSLKVVGDGPDFQKLNGAINDKGLNKQVKYLGVLDEVAVRQEMEKADFLFFPSLAEGFGLSIVEAQSVGCIPVAFKIDGVTDFIIEDGVNGILCEYKNVCEMYRKISEVLCNQKKLYEMKLNAIENSKRFSIANTATKWIELASSTAKREKILSDKNKFRQVIDNLCISASKSVTQYRNQIINFYINAHSNNEIELIKKKRTLLFGTLLNSYLTFTYLKHHNIDIVGFIDNNEKKEYLCGIPVVSEDDLSNLKFDLIIVTVESNSRYLIKERIQNNNKNIKVKLWDDFLLTN